LEIIYVGPCLDPDDDDYTCIKPSDIEKAIGKASFKPILISIMYANNETGSVNDIEKIGKIANKYDIFFHTDATQALGKFVIHPKKININAMSFSGHKFHGPKGTGGLYLDSQHKCIANLCFGGEQEKHIRPGTENVAGIVGMTVALVLVHENRQHKNEKLQKLKDYIIQKLKESEKITVFASKNPEKSLPNTIYLMFHNIGQCNLQIAKELSDRGICIGLGSACQTGKPSHVIETLGITKYKTHVMRISMSDYTTKKECDHLIKNLIEIIRSNPPK